MARLADPDLALRRRQQILEAAELCFRRRGFHQATMQEICAEARISPGALYRYFDSKSDIIAAISEVKHREAEEEFERIVRERSFREALESVMQRFLAKFAHEEFGSLFCDIAGEAARDPILAAKLAAIEAQSMARLAESVKAAQELGQIDSALDPLVAAQTITTFMDGLAMRLALRQSSDTAAILHQFRILADRYLAPRR